METIIPAAKPEVKPVLPKLGEFGNGRYSKQMESFFDMAQRVLKISEQKADKLTRQVASDYGASMAKADVKWGKTKSPSKEGTLTLKEMASKVKGVYATNALMCLVAVQYAEEAFKHGIHIDNTSWKPIDQIQDYLNQL